MIAGLFPTADPEPLTWRVPMISRAALAAIYLAIALNLHAAAPPSVFGDTVFQVRDLARCRTARANRETLSARRSPNCGGTAPPS